MTLRIRMSLYFILSVFSFSVHALESFDGKVTVLEPTYLPGTVTFIMDTGNATCPSGRWLTWQNPDTKNNLAVYSTLMTALITGKRVRFHFNDGDTSCLGRYLHLL